MYEQTQVRILTEERIIKKMRCQYSLKVECFVETIRGARGSPFIVSHLPKAQHHELFKFLMELGKSSTNGIWALQDVR